MRKSDVVVQWETYTGNTALEAEDMGILRSVFKRWNKNDVLSAIRWAADAGLLKHYAKVRGNHFIYDLMAMYTTYQKEKGDISDDCNRRDTAASRIERDIGEFATV